MKKYMQYPEFHARWEKLVFVPLDIPMPPCDHDLICEYMSQFPGRDHENYMRKQLGYGPLTPEEWLDTEFDYFRSFRVFSNKPHFDWRCEIFREMFPDVEEWFQTLPLETGKRLSFGWINQLTPEYNKTYPTSNIHTDEPGSFGLRWYSGNTDNNMYFYGTRNDITIPEIDDLANSDFSWDRYHNTQDQSLNAQGLPRANHNFYEHAVPVDAPENCGFILGQNRAAHVIKTESQHNKITYIIEPIGRQEHTYLWQDVSDIIERSIDLYPDQVIWHEDLCD